MVKVGDKFKRLSDGAILTINAVGQTYALATRINAEEFSVRLNILSDENWFTKIVPFFEKGKTYRHKLGDGGNTFDVHYVSYIGAQKNNKRVAFGQLNMSSYSEPVAWFVENFNNWEEI